MQDQGPKNGTDLYDRPVLTLDPDMHNAIIRSLAVDANGHFAVTGSDDYTVRDPVGRRWKAVTHASVDLSR
jgi:hypothetical protein